MLNERKVKLMSENALFENKRGREIVRQNRFDRMAYVWSHIYRNIPYGILTCALVYVLVFAALQDEILQLAEDLGSLWFFVLAAVVMSLFVISYCCLSAWMQARRYDRIRGEIWTYSLNRKRLEDMEQEEEAASASKETP